ncbi:MAG: hypothetical protein V4574_11425 [Pseudomonadota bacterium]
MTLLFAALLIAVQEPAPPPSEAERAAARIVCKRQAKTGTRFKRAICHTRAEWDAIAASAQRNAHEMADRPAIPLYDKQDRSQ